MLFEVHSPGRSKWSVRHILTKNDVMGPKGPLHTKRQAEVYADLFEKSPFIWHFTNPKDLTILNNRDDLEAFVIEAREKALDAK